MKEVNSKRIGVINDLHGPWHDPRKVKLVLEVLEDKVDELWLNGDIFDFHNINRHKKKDPRIQSCLEDEFYWGNEFFSDIRKKFILKGKKVKYIRGNHEEWLDEYLINSAPAFWNICQLEKMVDLSDIEIHPYNTAVQVGNLNLYVQHSPPSYAKTGPFTALKDKSDASYIWGCTHRMGHATVTGTQQVYHGYFNGWLGSTTLSDEHFRVFKYQKGHANWQSCFAVITIIEDRYYFINQYEISADCTVLFDGYLYEL